ncbi:MAG: nucleotidyl transferase AbiEii/AbiGii toxin family protein [Chitinophagales bacterium]
MLHIEAVEPGAFSILKQLMEMTELKNFSLVGGTALSLYYGHRKSIDLDLFSYIPFENPVIIDTLEKKFRNAFVNRTSNPRFGIFGFVKDVKIDFVRHPLIRPELNIGDIRMFSIEDMIAMKVQAILGRGRRKNFWDIAEFLQHFSVADFIKFHNQKYASQNLLITMPQALAYFADAEESEDPISLKKQTWETVKEFINGKVREYLE